jgi:hypothetical protein
MSKLTRLFVSFSKLTLISLVSILFFSQISAQVIIKRFDWDANTSLGTPTVVVTQTPAGGTCTYTGANSSAAGTSGIVPQQTDAGISGGVGVVSPVGATYGVNSATDASAATAGLVNDSASKAFYVIGGQSTCTQPRRMVTVTFPAISGSMFTPSGDVKISFRSIGLGLDTPTSGSGSDQTDSVVMGVSLDGGTTFSNENGLAGNANTLMDYNPANTVFTTYDGNNAAAINLGTTANPSSRAELSITSGTVTPISQVVLRFTIQVNRGDEFVGLDDIIVSQLVPTASNASVSGRVLNTFGRGAKNTSVTLTSISGETRYARVNQLGFFSFREVETGQTYIVNAYSKGLQFNSQVVTVTDNIEGLLISPQ